MLLSVLYHIGSAVLSTLLFIAIIVFYFAGLKISQNKRKKDPANESAGLGPFEGAMLGLVSLLLAFTFNQSAAHYDTRRSLIINETNCIGTVLLRADLYPDSLRTEFKNDLKEYITERIRYYEEGENENEMTAALEKANTISAKIWKRAALIAQKNEVVIKSMQMIPAINDMIDAVSKREEARTAHIPESILWLLFILCIAGSFIVGYACKTTKADWVILISYSLITVLTVYTILDLDQPNKGIIKTNLTHQTMYDLLNGFEKK